MDNKHIRVGINCIGSGVGQSIINSCNISNLPITSVGFGNNPYAFGAYDCDLYDYTPSIYEDNYIEEINKKYKQYELDLLIPSLDNEVLLLSENKELLIDNGLNIILPDKQISQLSRNKDKMREHFPLMKESFVATYSLNEIKGIFSENKNIFPLIAKPRGGFGSKGIKIVKNIADLSGISDEYIIQEIAYPSRLDRNYSFFTQSVEKGIIPQVSEISVQLVTDKYGTLIGRMASINKLKNGIPIEILPIDNSEVWKTIDKLFPILQEYGLKGPINIQGRLTDDGFKIFEMNPRFTGITGLRAIMGFNEVEACIKSWLNMDFEPLIINNKKFGIRQTADKVISLERNKEVNKQYNILNKRNNNKEKIILITGYSGFFGSHLIPFLEKPNYKLWLVGRSKNKLSKYSNLEDISCFNYSDFESGKLKLGHVDILIHLGFARAYHPYQEIANSLDFTIRLFHKAFLSQIPSIINITSHRVYGFENQPPYKEKMKPAPESPYAQAKFATEVILDVLNKKYKHIAATSLRFPTLTGGNVSFDENELIFKLIEQSKNNGEIKIICGDQILERLDVRDAAKAIVALLDLSPLKWKNKYNVGQSTTNKLLDIAKKVVDITYQFNNGKKPQIILENGKTNMRFGMDSSLFMYDTGWKPQFKLEDSILSILKNMYK